MSPRNPKHRIEITLSDERLAALDEARGNEARASFIKRATDTLITETEGRDWATHPPRTMAEAQRLYERAKAHVLTRSYVDQLAHRGTPVRQGGTYDSHPHRNVSAKPAAARKPRPKGKR